MFLFFVGAQAVVTLLQTTQIISDACFITDHVAYASSNQNQNRLNRDGFSFVLFLPGVDASHVYVRAWALGCFRRALTASVDRCAEIKSDSSVA